MMLKHAKTNHCAISKTVIDLNYTVYKLLLN